MDEQIIQQTQIPLTLKAKFLFIIAFCLREKQSSESFALLTRIKSEVTSSTDLEDDISVSGNIPQIMSVVGILGQQPEFEMAATNKCIQLALVQQLMALSAGQGDIACCAAHLLGILQANAYGSEASLNLKIQAGRKFITG